MMSGLRSQRENTITCVSERSGMASSGTLFMAYTASATANAVSTMTMKRLCAENSMTFSTIPARSSTFSAMPARSSLLLASGRVRPLSRLGQSRLEPRLRVDEEVARGQHLLSLSQAPEDLVPVRQAQPDGDLARL